MEPNQEPSADCDKSGMGSAQGDVDEVVDGQGVQLSSRPKDAPPRTLGDVLYAGQSQPLVDEREWVELVRAVADRDQAALHALYARTHRLVFTLALRINGNRESAEEVTLDVFHELWRRARSYDSANGTVLGWVMNLTRSRAIDRVRTDQRKKRVNPQAGGFDEETDVSSHEIVEAREQVRALRSALTVLGTDERRVIEAAFFGELTHVQVASKFNMPLGTVKTRIRSGLLKLRRALDEQAGQR
jgi:RNA polymerase sigma-70 factor (ECF subfamily)